MTQVTERTCIMAVAVADGPVMTLATLRERYRHYALTIRSVSAELVRKRFLYLGRVRRLAHLPRALPESCIVALGRSIERQSSVGCQMLTGNRNNKAARPPGAT